MTSSLIYVIRYDPYVHFVLYSAAIGWSSLGLLFLEELWNEAPSLNWKMFLFPFVGPAAWGILLYWGLVSLRRAILGRLHLPDCSCCGH